MSDTPTYANLLARLFSDLAEDRAAAVEYLQQNPAQAHAVDQGVRDRLRDEYPLTRVRAAEVILRVYGDRAAAIDALAGVLKQGDPAVATTTPGVIQQLGRDGVPLVLFLARHTPSVFGCLGMDEFYRWVGAETIRTGPDGLSSWLELLQVEGQPRMRVGLMMGLADAAPGVDYDLTPAEGPLRGYLGDDSCRSAAGAALWRVTWRVNRDWLERLDPHDTRLAETPGLRVFLLEVLVEQLGRGPRVTGRLRDLLATLTGTDDVPAVDRIIGRLAGLGMRGWGVLLSILPVPRDREDRLVMLRLAIYREAALRPAVLPLVHHIAHGAIADAAAARASNMLVPGAAWVLAKLGPAAGSAVPDLLALAVRDRNGEAWEFVELALPRVAAGYPNAPAAVVRALHQLRTAADFGERQLPVFQALCRVLAALSPDAGPGLAEKTAVESRVADLVVQQPPWKDAAPEVRQKHARLLADLLGHPRPEVRVRAADLLRHYRDQFPAVWPALVATLTGADEKLGRAVLPHFRHLEGATDAVTAELVALFKEPNPTIAARAVVALWRMGRMPVVTADLRASVEADPVTGWGWAVLRGVVDRIAATHGMPGELAAVFAASPAAVAERVLALVNAPESAEEVQLSAVVPRPGDGTRIDWDGVHRLIGSDLLGLFVYLGLMLEHGSTGYANQKGWLIKNLRTTTGMGLADSKRAIERAAERVPHPGASAADRHQAARDCFPEKAELPSEVLTLLEHPNSWYRWAGLELADAWGLTAEQAEEIGEERVWDCSPRVRERALRMVRG